MKLTQAQLNAIETKNKTLLLSAAAGSGKTSTLTRRIINSITDKDDPEKLKNVAQYVEDVTSNTADVVVGKAVKEAKERVRYAIKNTNFNFPANKIAVNLAPANVKKAGANFDLAIAIGILLSTSQIKMK